MHILIIAIGSAGDVHPFLGLGQSFVARGHRVSFAANPVFQPLVERCGLRFLPVGTAEEYHAAMGNPALWSPRTSLPTLWQVIASTLRPLYQTLVAEADDDTVMLGSLWAFSARLVQEKLGVPLVTAQVSPSTILSAQVPPVHKRFTIPEGLPGGLKSAILWLIERGVLDRICGPALNALRSELGLAPASRIMGRWMHSPQGVLGLFPDWFAPPQRDWPSQLAQVGFPLFDEAGFHQMDAGLQDFLAAGSPPVVFTPGSTMLEGQAFFRGALAALRKLDRRGIFLTKDPAQVPELPPQVLLRPYVPMSALLPHAAALVHHGGIGTTALAFAAGIPQLATPFAHDQFDNAARIERLGCGVRLDAPAADEALTDSLRYLLEDSAVAAACKRLQLRVDSSEVACGKAVDFVEAAVRRPLAAAAGQSA
jgi:rhamnosyltransferase subunit B